MLDHNIYKYIINKQLFVTKVKIYPGAVSDRKWAI